MALQNALECLEGSDTLIEKNAIINSGSAIHASNPIIRGNLIEGGDGGIVALDFRDSSFAEIPATRWPAIKIVLCKVPPLVRC